MKTFLYYKHPHEIQFLFAHYNNTLTKNPLTFVRLPFIGMFVIKTFYVCFFFGMKNLLYEIFSRPSGYGNN